MGTYHEGMFAHDGGNPDDVYYQAIYAHEAGHAVAQHVLGQPCKYITVTMLVEAEDSTNITMGYQRDTVRLHKILRGKRKLTAIPKLVMDEAIIRCAGPAAELRWCTERRFPIRVLFGSLTDHDNVQRLFRWASRQGLSHGHDHYDQAWNGAVALLADNWAAVRKLTAALEAGVSEACGESFTMRGRDIAAIYKQRELT
jgi:hypothetical protein